MHDLLREMALRITNVKPRYMVRAGIGSQVPEEHDWAFDLDSLSFHKSEIKGIPEDMAPNCPTLSTLLFHYCCLRVIPESFFQHMNNLQVLDLSYNSELMDLPSCISNLGSLKSNFLRQCKQLRSVPPLGKLKNLRVLDVSGTGIKEVPQGMGNLVKLKFLDMGGVDLDELPKEILPKLSHLQYLSLPPLMHARGEDLASLELLEEFKGRFCYLHYFNKFMRNSRNYEKDWWYDARVRLESSPVLHNDSGNHRVEQRKVTLQSFSLEADGGEAPTSIILPHCIQILHINNCHGLSSCLVDNFLLRTTLRGLNCEISHCDDIEWIVNVPSGRNTTTDPHCISFHRLVVFSLPNLVGLCKGKITSHVPCHTFSGVTKLHIAEYPRMKNLIPRAILQDLKNIQKLEVGWCVEMEEIIEEEATDEEGSSQSSNPQQHLITSSSYDSSISSDILILQKLKEIHLQSLHKLKRICEGKLFCDSLELMTCLDCRKLKRLPFYTPTTNGHPFPALRDIEVEENWWETLEWDQSHVKTLF